MTRISPSRYFNNYDHAPRQKMIEDLIIHSIKMNGVVIQYMPREEFDRDELFGEDPITRFKYAIEMEAYPKDVDGFGGQGDVFSKFGLEIRDTITFVISRKRWQQLKQEKIKLEEEWNILLEDDPKTPWLSNTLMCEGGKGYQVKSFEPQPGDLIYFDMPQKILEITHVDDENLFYEHGIKMTYDLACEVFNYTSEEFTTGNPDIDSVDDMFNTNRLNNKFLMEDGSVIVSENADDVTQEGVMKLEEKDDSAFNLGIQREAETIVNWSERSPFAGLPKW